MFESNLISWFKTAPDLMLKLFDLAEKIQSTKVSIAPNPELIFKAFKDVSPTSIKIVILGQDCYPSPNKAMGRAFAINPNWAGNAYNSSFLNIYNEVLRTTHGKKLAYKDFDTTLEHWAKQGIMLLNTRLTVEINKPMSHAGLGWEPLTRAIIEKIDELNPDCIFMFWGNEARSYKSLIKNGHVLEASHPCKYSAHISFINCDHFNKANKLLTLMGYPEIDWYERQHERK